MRLIRLVPLALGFGLVAGCGGTDTNGGGDAGPGVSMEELPAKYAEAFCQVFTSCVGDLYGVYRPGEECLEDFTISVAEELATLPSAVDGGRVKYDGTKVQKCLNELAMGDCSTLSKREPESCKAAIQGTVKQGDSCTLDLECSGEQYCRVDDRCPGTCAPYEQAGATCTTDDHCADGLKCGKNDHCVAPAQEGEACEQGEPECTDGLVCLGQDDKKGTPGACYPISVAFGGKQDDPCGLDAKLCGAGYACEITSLAPVGGNCVARVDSGGTCHAAFPDECPDDEYCALGDNPLAGGNCTPKPKAGEKCVAGLGDTPICAPYTRCDAKVCREIAHAGETCSNDDTCYSEHCVDNACVTGNSCG